QAAAVLEDARRAAERAAHAFDQIADEATIRDLRGTVHHLHDLMHAAARGPGLVHALFYDRRTATSLRRMAAGLGQRRVSVGHSLRRVDAILSATDRQLLNRVAQAAKQLGGVAEQLERSQLVAKLSRAAGDLAEMTSHARAGGGTIGALVKDPTVYE